MKVPHLFAAIIFTYSVLIAFVLWYLISTNRSKGVNCQTWRYLKDKLAEGYAGISSARCSCVLVFGVQCRLAVTIRNTTCTQQEACRPAPVLKQHVSVSSTPSQKRHLSQTTVFHEFRWDLTVKASSTISCHVSGDRQPKLLVTLAHDKMHRCGDNVPF